ncbi:MAG: ferritin-like domain-containing protein [Chloroflexi bacterium]|nr:ferritin-like domain-containing protein [Chloroflexota bacterium]
MPIQNPQDLFVWMLSDVRHREERSKQFFNELSQSAQDPDVKETLDAWVYMEDKIVNTLDQCFRIIGKQPVQTAGKLHDVFVEDFRRELGTIQSPLAKTLFVAHTMNKLMHLHMGEYKALVAMSDITGHYALGALIETCLADNYAFVERTHRRIRQLIESEMGGAMRKVA